MADVRLRGVERRYEDAVALDGVDVTVADGEFFTLVGPSGCGKTTTLRTIAGLEEPTSGTVHVGGESMAGVPPEDRDVGIVFQNYALFPHMTVAENVAYGLRFRDPPEGKSEDERVRELLELVDMADYGDRMPEELSGGQQQRVALVRALAPGPRLLLLDEPMSALDARLRERLRRQVRTIQSELGVTTVYVTHDQEEALAVSDRVAVMNGGRVEQVGTPQEIYHRPETPFVAEFVGKNNRFEGEVIGREGDDALVEVDGTTFRVRAPEAAGRVAFYVRPEALSLGREGKNRTDGEGENRIAVTVETTEFLGDAARTYGSWNGREIVVKSEDVPAGERVVVAFGPEDATVV